MSRVQVVNDKLKHVSPACYYQPVCSPFVRGMLISRLVTNRQACVANSLFLLSVFEAHDPAHDSNDHSLSLGAWLSRVCRDLKMDRGDAKSVGDMERDRVAVCAHNQFAQKYLTPKAYSLQLELTPSPKVKPGSGISLHHLKVEDAEKTNPISPLAWKLARVTLVMAAIGIAHATF